MRTAAGWLAGLALALGAAGSSGEAATQEASAGVPAVARATASRVNVRAGANPNYEVLAQLDAGDRVLVAGYDGEWAQVHLPQTARCYISAKYVERHGTRGRVTTDRVNIRARPATTASILGQVHRDRDLAVVEEQAGWYRIRPLAEWVGYVKRDYLQPESGVSVEQFTADEQRAVGQTVSTAAPAAASRPPLYIGEVRGVGRWFRHPSQHRLVIDCRTAAYLVADAYPLAELEHQTVAIWGDQQTSHKWKAPLVRVTRLERVSTAP